MTEYDLSKKRYVDIREVSKYVIIGKGDLAKVPTADVVERSKIDNAIEEIEEQRHIHYTNVSDVIDSVLEILKINIGE